MALLDDLFLPGGGFSVPATAGFDPVTKEPLTQQEMAAAARDAAALRLASATKSVARAKSPYPWAGDYAEASPFPGMGMGALADPSATAFPAQAPQQAATDPIAGEPQLFQNGVPMPRPRPAEADGPAPLSLAPPMADGGLLPAASTPTIGLDQPAQQPGQPQVAPAAVAAPKGPSILDRIFNPNHAATMLALGAGFAGAPSFGTGMSRAFGAAVPAMAADRAFEQKQQGIAQTYTALVSAGVDKNTALAASLNPEVLKVIAPEHFGGFKVVQTGEGAFGDKIFKLQGPGGKIYDIPPSGAAPGTVPGQSTGGGGDSFLAKGVTQINHDLAGEDYLKQFSPEMQAAVKSYVAGESMPTGNPRKGFTQAVKMAAQKYGSDIGLPADDTTFTARRQMRNQLSSAAPNSLGGQINIGNTAIGHLSDLSDKALALNNKDIGIAPLSHGINTVRGLTSEQAAKLESLKAAAQHYGQEVTKFYAGSPGGVAERDRFMDAVSGAKTPQELAGVISTEAELMQSRLTALDSQIRGTLGPMADKYPVIRPESKDAISRIDANVSRLKSGTSASAAAPARPAVTPPPGKYQWDPNGGLRALQ